MSHEPEWCEYGDCRDTSGHEPECMSCHYLYGHKEIRGSECICDQLRACRERTIAECIAAVEALFAVTGETRSLILPDDAISAIQGAKP